MAQSSAVLTLADGRRLDVWLDESREAEGLTPLLFHHGTPGSGVDYEPFDAAARQRGLRFVSWSRPGYGSSTRQPGRRVSDIATDAAAVLDHLGLDTAYVVGHSGGGPHALACAALLPDRLLGTALIAGVAPWDAGGLEFLEGMGAENHEEFTAAARGEDDLAAFLGPFREGILGSMGPEMAASLGDLIDDVDRGALTGEYAEFLAANMHEGLRESAYGWLDDDIAFTKPWGFDIGSITRPVHIWQGGHDRMVPFAHGRWLGEHVGNPCLHLHPEHGHLSIAVAGFGAILDALVENT